VVQPAPAPKFDRTPPETPEAPHNPGADTDEVLAEYGLTPADITTLRTSGAIT
jgi:alpha-methylacyl-CoA racemase